MICKICGKEFKKLSNHLKFRHKITVEKYYIQYVNLNSSNDCLCCGSKTKFISVQRGYLKYCSYECVKKSQKEIIELRKENNIEKYGVSNPNKLNLVKNKIKQTCLTKYGVESTNSLKLVKDKKQKTYQEKYGVNNISQLESIKKQKENTCLKNYSIKCGLLKNKEENIKKEFEIFYILLKERLEKENIIPLFTKNEYSGYNKNYRWKCNICNIEFIDNIYCECPKCHPYISSEQENEISYFLDSLNIKYKRNDRILIKPLELDFVIPEHKLAIEFDGIYWHSELAGKDKNYHLNKTELCNFKDYQLIHIFSNEWILKQEIIKSILKSKLGIYDSKIEVNDCILKELKYSEIEEFLNSNHIQGSVYSSINLGLFYQDELVFVCTFSKSRFNKKYDYELLRFCSKLNIQVISGLSMCLEYFKYKYSDSLVSYCNRRFSNGSMHLNVGFKLINSLKPNYWYFNDKTNLYNKKIIKIQNMKLNGYNRIFDCGNLVFSV